jgi:hypothetical protein
MRSGSDRLMQGFGKRRRWDRGGQFSVSAPSGLGREIEISARQAISRSTPSPGERVAWPHDGRLHSGRMSQNCEILRPHGSRERLDSRAKRRLVFSLSSRFVVGQVGEN